MSEQLNISNEKFNIIHNEIFKGCKLPAPFKKIQKDIEDLEVYDDDVWLCGFPKSGTTWSQEMIWCIGNDLDFKAAEEKLEKRFILLELSSLVNAQDDTDLPDIVVKSVEVVKNMKRPRYIKTHLPWTLLPKQITNFEKRPKIICVTRNPMDILVSAYYFSNLIGGYTGDIELLSRSFLQHEVIFTPYKDHVFGYWNRRNESNVLCIKYEDMKRNLSSVIDTVAEFLGKTLPESGKNELISHLSFDSLKKTQTIVPTDMIKGFQKTNETHDTKGHFMRSGQSGGYRTEMSQEAIDLFKREIVDVLEKEGLKFTM